MLIVVSIIIAIYIMIRYAGNKSSKKIQEKQNAFWERENQANSVRKKDLSDLNYIKIPLDSLPMIDTDDTVLQELQWNIKQLSDKPIVNLTGFTNTDLKLQYGTANINYLSQCDGNFIRLAQILYKWGSYLYEHGFIKEAVMVLEFGVFCKTDVSKQYLLLAKIYQSQKNFEKIDALIQTAETLNSLTKEHTIHSLKEIKMSYFLE